MRSMRMFMFVHAFCLKKNVTFLHENNKEKTSWEIQGWRSFISDSQRFHRKKGSVICLVHFFKGTQPYSLCTKASQMKASYFCLIFCVGYMYDVQCTYVYTNMRLGHKNRDFSRSRVLRNHLPSEQFTYARVEYYLAQK